MVKEELIEALNNDLKYIKELNRIFNKWIKFSKAKEGRLLLHNCNPWCKKS